MFNANFSAISISIKYSERRPGHSLLKRPRFALIYCNWKKYGRHLFTGL